MQVRPYHFIFAHPPAPHLVQKSASYKPLHVGGGRLELRCLRVPPWCMCGRGVAMGRRAIKVRRIMERGENLCVRDGLWCVGGVVIHRITGGKR